MAQPTAPAIQPALLPHAPWIPLRYADYAGDQERVLRAICYTLSQRVDQVDWGALTADDWQLLGHMAEGERVGPLLHYLFKTEFGFPAALPGAVQARLHQQALRTAVHNKLLFAELERILAALDEAGIPVIVLKGAALAHTVYPDPSVRPMSDIDLLVPRHQLAQAVTLVEAMGYAQGVQLTPWYNHIAGHHVALSSRAAHAVRVELHWSLIGGDHDRRSPEIDWFWQQVTLLESGVRHKPLPILAPPGHARYLAAHQLLQHQGADQLLQWVVDLALLMQKERAFDSAENRVTPLLPAGWDNAYAASLRRAAALFGFPVRSLPLARVEDLKRQQLGLPKTRRTLTSLSDLRPIAWLATVFAATFPSRDYMRLHYPTYPPRFWFVAYFARWRQQLRHLWTKSSE